MHSALFHLQPQKDSGPSPLRSSQRQQSRAVQIFRVFPWKSPLRFLGPVGEKSGFGVVTGGHTGSRDPNQQGNSVLVGFRRGVHPRHWQNNPDGRPRLQKEPGTLKETPFSTLGTPFGTPNGTPECTLRSCPNPVVSVFPVECTKGTRV